MRSSAYRFSILFGTVCLAISNASISSFQSIWSKIGAHGPKKSEKEKEEEIDDYLASHVFCKRINESLNMDNLWYLFLFGETFPQARSVKEWAPCRDL